MYTHGTQYPYAVWNLVRGSYSSGRFCEQLEGEIRSRLNVEYALCMPQARVGIYMAIASSVERGREVILSPNTIADVINMVICAGAIPVFCDIDPQTGNLDPDLVEPLINTNTAAILVTHLYGLVAPMDRLSAIAKKHNLILIEDAAQAFGAKLNGKWAGSIGDVGVFSFGMAKNITSFLGGMLVTSRRRIYDSVRARMQSFPMISKQRLTEKVISCLIKDIFSSDIFFPKLLFKIFRFGYKHDINAMTKLIESELDLSLKKSLPIDYQTKLSPLQAQMILKKIDRINDDFLHRLKCARLYHDGLKDIDELRLPPLLEDGSHVYNYYAIGYKDRTALRMHLMDCNRDVALQHIKNTADLPAFKPYYRDCPHCRIWANETIMMPNYIKYRLDEVERNITAIRSFFGK
jgi:dTDP-4-amino-4,6-dideoxygalactose transaminase